MITMTAENIFTAQYSTGIVWDPGYITCFRFEEDFMEDNVRCIPMIVRFKLDACGIKLKLEEWCRFTVEERNMLVHKNCTTYHDTLLYRTYLQQLVLQRTGLSATDLPLESEPAWADEEKVFNMLAFKAKQLGIYISVRKWTQLTNLQRFALIKLSRQSHESKNLPAALKEFGLLKEMHEILI